LGYGLSAEHQWNLLGEMRVLLEYIEGLPNGKLNRMLAVGIVSKKAMKGSR